MTLRLPSEKLAKFPAGSSRNPNPEIAPEDACADGVPVPIVESNLPRSVPDAQAKARNSKIPKKRVREEDLDEDFAAVPSRDRRTQKQQRESRRTAIEDHTIQEISDDDDMTSSDDDDQVTAEPSERVNTSGKQRRSLPGYLAQRQADSDAPVPKELASGQRHRSGNGRRPSPGSQLAHGAVADDVDSAQEANMQAKQRIAARIADGRSVSASEAESEDEDGSLLAEPSPKRQKTVVVTKPLPSRGGMGARGGLRGRGSIFSGRGRGGKIKISSAKK